MKLLFGFSDVIFPEKRVFRKRGTPEQQIGFQKSPKQICFSIDVSNSMSRGNQWDGRLDRMADSVVLILEAFEGLDHKYKCSLIAHSGNGVVSLVEGGNFPRTQVAKFNLIQTIRSLASSSRSGDASLLSCEKAIELVSLEPDADDYIVVIFSDARLGQYGITPHHIAKAISKDPRINTFFILIAEKEAALWLSQSVPNGRVLCCDNPQKLPTLLKNILAASTIHHQNS